MPYCAAGHLTTKGTRQKKFETVQRWRCRACRRVFTPAHFTARWKMCETGLGMAQPLHTWQST
jgi:transposase-like protein